MESRSLFRSRPRWAAVLCTLASSLLIHCGPPGEAAEPPQEEGAAHEHSEVHPAVPQKIPVAPLLMDEWATSKGLCGEGERCVSGWAPGGERSQQAIASSSKRTRGTNTQALVPNNIHLADVNADGWTDFLQYSSNKIFVSNTDFDKTGILHAYLGRPIKRMLTGDFHGDGYDQTCAILDTNALQCFGIGADRRELWWWFTQGSFIGDNEDAIVGDYNGDRREDILVYNRSNGQFRMYALQGDYFFYPMPAFQVGNLTGLSAGMTVRAGDFNGDGRDDVMVVNGYRQVIYYVSVFDGTNNTFWWAFTSNGGVVGADDQVSVARVDNNAVDDVVLRNRVTGATRFFRMEYQNGNLPALTGVSTGQIATYANAQVFWGIMHGALSEPGAYYREDAMVFLNDYNMFVRSDARWDGSAYTYWWIYNQYAPNNHAGWAPFTAKPWLILKCKFADRPEEPQPNQFFRELFTSGGSGGTVDYFRDISYGSWDLSGNALSDTWYTMSVTLAQAGALDRYGKTQKCVEAYGGSTAGYVNVVALINAQIDSGFHGRVLLDPGAWNVTFAAHEMGHGFGFGHSYDDTSRRAADWSGPGEYWDHWDIMSAMNVFTFANHNRLTAGPEMNAPYKTKNGWIPAHRMTRLVPGTTRQSVTLNLASINRPEGNGALMVRVGSNDNDYYTIEYRMKSGWDQGIPRDTVLVHQVLNGVSRLITAGGVERLPGSSYTFASGFNLRVNSFATQGYTANVTIQY
jgi:hypothetical protein